jgi:dephospho-CoA kinase
MLKIGITGGIGSGKTTVCKIFETLGIPVYYADDRAKMLMLQDKHLIEGIKSLFGDQAYLADGALNRQHIAKIAFNDSSKLEQLNALVHPAVFKDGNKWADMQKNVPYTLKEAALIFEGGGHQFLDKVITVFAPKAVRIERVLKRDNTTRAEIEARIEKQMPDEEKVKMADFVIYNDGEQSLVEQVLAIHQALVA